MNDERDERIARLVRATQAEPDPAVWARVRARLLSGRARPASRGEAWIAWWSRPAAVAAAAAALVVVFGVGALASRGLAVHDTDTTVGTLEVASLSDWLLAEQESSDNAAPASDSGTIRQAPSDAAPGAAHDSGGPS